MKKVLFTFLGIIFVAISLFFAFLYLNLFTFGYNMQKYVYFISSRIECLLFIPGILLLFLAIKKKG